MNSILTMASCALVIGLAGCASPAPPLTDADLAELNAPLYCDSKEACDLLWRRAQAYVASNAGYKIQIANDTLIETYSPPDYSFTWAYRVMREPVAANRDRILVSLSCGRAPLCREREGAVAVRFKRYVKAVLQQ